MKLNDIKEKIRRMQDSHDCHSSPMDSCEGCAKTFKWLDTINRIETETNDEYTRLLEVEHNLGDCGDYWDKATAEVEARHGDEIAKLIKEVI